MMNCDCAERIGIKINSWKQFEDLKAFFEERVKKGIFVETPVEKPCCVGYHDDGTILEWYADKWYRCRDCGTLWEFEYPDFPAQGEVRKLTFDDKSERSGCDGY